jgi:hypothetical protein
MLDMKKVDTKSMRMDLIKNAVIVIVARLVKFYVIDTQGKGGDVMTVFNQEFVYSVVFLLLGFAVFWLAVEPLAREL